MGGADLSHRDCTASPRAPGWRSCCARATAPGDALRSRGRPRRLPARRARRGARTSSSSTRARRRRGAPCRWGCSRSASSRGGAPASRSRCSAKPPAGGCRSATATSACSPARGWPSSTREATVGVVLSLTNPSLVGLEMMACGLPCVELASESMLATFGTDGPLTARRGRSARALRGDRAPARRPGACGGRARAPASS